MRWNAVAMVQQANKESSEYADTGELRLFVHSV